MLCCGVNQLVLAGQEHAVVCSLKRVVAVCPHLLINRRINLNRIVCGLEPGNRDAVFHEQIGTSPAQPECP